MILAAGAGSRYGGPTHKLTAELDQGETLIGRAVRVAAAAADLERWRASGPEPHDVA